MFVREYRWKMSETEQDRILARVMEYDPKTTIASAIIPSWTTRKYAMFKLSQVEDPEVQSKIVLASVDNPVRVFCEANLGAFFSDGLCLEKFELAPVVPDDLEEMYERLEDD